MVDLRSTPREESFRAEVREWLSTNRPWEAPPPGSGWPDVARSGHLAGSGGEAGNGPASSGDELASQVAWGRRWQAELAAAGLVGVSWPVTYGGRGLGPIEQAIVNEELAAAGAPELVGRIGVNLAGPTLLAYGTPAQRERFLPGILPAGELWCQLFSEPEAGSDLTSLTTSARRVPAGYLLSGTKVWTSYAQFADWGICLARTDSSTPGPGGLSFFIVDCHHPGMTVRPLVQITGDSEFNEVLMDDVFVPADQLVGTEGDGWRVAGATLGTERGINPRQLATHRQRLESLLAMAGERDAFSDRRSADRLAEAWVEVLLFDLLTKRTLSRLAKGAASGPESSCTKLYWSEMSKRLHTLAMDLLGARSPISAHGTTKGSGVDWQRAWLYSRATTIFSGTSEIQRNIIAERVLRLPREQRGTGPSPSDLPRSAGKQDTGAGAGKAGAGKTGAGKQDAGAGAGKP